MTRDKIKEYRNKAIESYIFPLEELLQCTNSPIEELFLSAFLVYHDLFTIKLDTEGRDFALVKWYNNDIRIYPQFEIEKYLTVDFVLKVTNGKLSGKIIVIECDGHDFHEKTKEQAKRDKQRDRKLTKLGYNILHFSGSEIYNNPKGCILEIDDLIIEMMERKDA